LQLRAHAVLPHVAVCLALAVAPAFAAKPEPTPLAPPTAPSVGTPSSTTNSASSCALGVLGPPTIAYAYVLPPNDAYYTLIDPAVCAAFQTENRLLTVAHVELYFTAPCEVPVTVSVVPAIDLGGGCLAPDPFAPPICPPVNYVVGDGGALGRCVNYALPLPAGCSINGPAFLHIEFDEGSCPNGRPAFCGPAACSHCTQYNFYPGVGAPGDDLCAVLTPYQLTGPIMYVESTCCLPTSTTPGSWGVLKTLYR
jgi:hypothetical protein